MSATLPGFTLAPEIPPSDEELEEIIHGQEAEIERLRGMRNTLPACPEQTKSNGPMPEERQDLNEFLNGLLAANKELRETVEKQGRKIADQAREISDLKQDIEDIREYFPRLVAEDRARLTVLEKGTIAGEPKTVKSHLDGLHEHMMAIGRKQVSFREAAKIIGISKQRLHQFKAEIALDTRFIIVDSQSHKQKELIRLRE